MTVGLLFLLILTATCPRSRFARIIYVVTVFHYLILAINFAKRTSFYHVGLRSCGLTI